MSKKSSQSAEARIQAAVNKVKARQQRRDQAEQDRMARAQQAAARRLQDANRADLQRLNQTKYSDTKNRVKIIRGIEDRKQEATGQPRSFASSAARNAVDYVTTKEVRFKPAPSGASIAKQGIANISQDASRVLGDKRAPTKTLLGYTGPKKAMAKPQPQPAPYNDPSYFLNRDFTGIANKKVGGSTLDSYSNRLFGR